MKSKKIINQITNKTRKLQATWTYEAIADLGKTLHEEPLTEEEKIIERLKYTKKERDAMYQQSIEDVIAEAMSAEIAREIDAEILEKNEEGNSKWQNRLLNTLIF